MISENAFSQNDTRNNRKVADPPQWEVKKQRRDQLDLILALLEATKSPSKKTRLLYQTATNHEQLTRYLDLLLRLGMVERISEPLDGYLITDKGRALLMLFRIAADP
jgi:predicted transcriptional regulator